MKMIKFAAFVVLGMTVAGTASAVEYTVGQVTKVDTAQKKVTVKHEELVNLDMPAMTMVFNLADEAMLDEMAAGDQIEFVVERIRGKLTIVELK